MFSLWYQFFSNSFMHINSSETNDKSKTFCTSLTSVVILPHNFANFVKLINTIFKLNYSNEFWYVFNAFYSHKHQLFFEFFVTSNIFEMYDWLKFHELQGVKELYYILNSKVKRQSKFGSDLRFDDPMRTLIHIVKRSQK